MNIPTEGPKKGEKKRSWWQQLMEKLDKAMVEKSKKIPSCCTPQSKDGDKGGKCC